MERSYKATLQVNKKPIPMNRFVEEFLSHTTVGAVTSLRGAEDIEDPENTSEKG